MANLLDALINPLATRLEQQEQTKALLEPLIGEHRGEAQPKCRQRLLMVLWTLAAAALCLSGYLHRPLIRFARSFDFDTGLAKAGAMLPPAELSVKDQLLLGDPRISELEQKEQLLASDPSNPAYFAEYIGVYVSDYKSLPKNYQEQVARIDPDNALYPYIAATVRMENFLKREAQSAPRGQPLRKINGKAAKELRPSIYTILDRAAYDEAIAQLIKGSSMPRVEDYTWTMTRQRVSLVPFDSYAGFMRAMAYAFQSGRQVFALLKAADLICAQADVLADQGNQTAFREWCALRERVINQLLESPAHAVINELIYSAIASNTAVQLHHAAVKLGLPDLAETYGKQQTEFQLWKDKKLSERNSPNDSLIHRHGAIISGMSLTLVGSQVENPPVLSADDLKPMRLTEHDFFMGIITVHGAALMIVIAGLYLLARRCLPVGQRLPSIPFASLLSVKDWLIIGGFGILLPVLLHLLITRYTPLGAREYGMYHMRFFMFLIPIIPFVSLLISLLVVPSWLIQRRLSLQVPGLFPKSRIVWLRPMQILLLLIAQLIAMPILVFYRHNLGAYFLIGLPSIVLLAHWGYNSWHALRHGPLARLQLAVSASAMQAVFPLAIIVLCATLPISIASESNWIQQDRIHLPTSPESYEHQIAVQGRKELLVRLGRGD